MIGEVFQAGLNAPIIFAGDEDKTVGVANLAGEFFEPLGRLALGIFLVHPVQHRQADRLGVDQFDVVAARAQALDNELREPDAHAIGAIRAVEYEDAMGHGLLLTVLFDHDILRERGFTWSSKRSSLSCRPRECALQNAPSGTKVPLPRYGRKNR